MRVLIGARNAVVVAVVVAAAYLAYTSISLGATRAPSHRIILGVASTSDTPLYPGDSVHVRGTLTNDAAHPLELASGTIDGTVGHLPTGCLTSWFRFAVAAGAAAAVAGNGGTATVTGKLTFVEANTDQSACEGATPALRLSVHRRAAITPWRRST